MIFPFLLGLVSPRRAPFTYLLLFINVFVYFATYSQYEVADAKIEEILRDDHYLETQGTAFAQMVRRPASTAKFETTPTLEKVASQALDGDRAARRLLGSLAMRNSIFMQSADHMTFNGDVVALGEWRERFGEIRRLQSVHPSYTWGVTSNENNWRKWITYQFSHSGFMHLFWNMVFLVIFGCFVETSLGGSFVMLSYVGGGVVGAWAFASLSGLSASPLVGASAAVSALMGLVAFGWLKRERLRCFYWLLPIQGYFGFIALPSWIVIVVLLLPDVSGWLSTSPEMGSVAYAAHIGGASFGALLAFLVARGIFVSEHETLPVADAS